jgi:thioredoxin reductase
MTADASRHHYIILGAGPAGLQLAYCLHNAGRDYLVLERGKEAGTFFEVFPRHRKLISINKVYTGYSDAEVNLRWDWNSLLTTDASMRFMDYSRDYFPPAEAILRYLRDYAARFMLRIAYDSPVTHISRDEDGFELTTAQGQLYQSDVLVVATGLSLQYIPPIPGAELAESYSTMTIDRQQFINQRVLIIGKGNSAFETADHLVGEAAMMHLVSPHALAMAWKTHFPGHLRAVNNNLLETYRLKGQNAIINGSVQRITRNDDGTYHVAFSYHLANGEEDELDYDRIIFCTGFRFDDTIFDASCRPALMEGGRLPALTCGWRSENIPDLYFAGTTMQARDLKRAASAFIHGFRYNVQSLHRMLEVQYEDRPWPVRRYPSEPDALGQAILDRINRSSGLWQQFGYLCDLVVIDAQAREAVHYEEIPVDYVPELTGRDRCDYYTVTLEYGDDHGTDPFATVRIHKDDFTRADQSAFLHPVIRRFRDGRLAETHHVIEDLMAEWREEVHVAPLHAFLREQMAELSASG